MSVLATRSAADPPVNGCSTTAIQDESGAQSTAEPIIFEASLYERAFGFRTVHNKDTSSPLPAHGPHVETGSPTSHGTQNADLHQAGPGYYVPWLPRQDDAGVLSALHERAFLVFFFSTCAIVWTGAMVFLVLTMAQWNVGMVFIRLVGYFTELFNILRGAINWFPMFLVYNIWRRLPEDRKTQRWLAFIVALGLFLFFAWVNHKLSKSDSIFEAWQHQSMLFTPGRLESSHSNSSFGRDVFDRGVYHVQFDRIHVTMKNLNSTNWVRFFWIESLNATQFQEIHGNQTLCSQGFQGDSDYYGIGIRGGLYLQWAGSLLANNFLPSSRTELQKVYLVFSLAICIATMVTTLSATCTFSIEIEILYWMYWGGYICVFGSAPDTFVLGPQTGPKTKWVHLDWTTAIVFITHMAMTYHGSWFVWYAYDSFFARWPCGTYQFFLAPLFDPSEAFSRARDLLTVLWLPVVPPLLMVFPFLALLLATEVKHTIQHAAVFGLVFHRHDAEVAEADMNAIANRTLCQRVYKKIEIGYGILRSKLRLPPHARKGIRLITSVDIKHRRHYRIRCALFGILAFGITIAAIELTLKWNKVMNINHLAAPGQYISLIIGASCLISVIWHLTHEEAERRRKERIRQIVQQDDEGIELQTTSTRFSDAISHAFNQRDSEFLRSGGLLPATEPEAPRYSDAITGDDVVMSGALAVIDEPEPTTT